MAQWTLHEYRDVFTEFCERELAEEPELASEIDQRLRRLRELGNQARMPMSEPLGGGLFACRASSAKHHARLIYCFLPEKRIVIVLCLLKDQRRLAAKDVAEARNRKLTIEAHGDQIHAFH